MSGSCAKHRNLNCDEKVKRHKPQKGEAEIAMHSAGAEELVVAMKKL